MLKVNALVLGLVLMGGCTLNQPVNATIDKVEVEMKGASFPFLANPPPPHIYLDTNGVITPDEARNYYLALEDYHTYLDSYLGYLNVQYELNLRQATDTGCKDMDSIAIIHIENLPLIRYLPEDRITDALLDHIGHLRESISQHNSRIKDLNHDIQTKCM